MVQSRFRGKDDCVYCDQPFFVYVLFVCLIGCWDVLVFSTGGPNAVRVRWTLNF